jgi:hypothetical protein
MYNFATAVLLYYILLYHLLILLNHLVIVKMFKFSIFGGCKFYGTIN